MAEKVKNSIASMINLYLFSIIILDVWLFKLASRCDHGFPGKMVQNSFAELTLFHLL